MLGRDDIVSEGQVTKKYGVSHGGQAVGSWDTATEAWKGFQEHRDKVQPIIDPKKALSYTFRQDGNAITLEKFQQLVKAEELTKKN